MKLTRGFETVIGVEIHAELKTKAKVFCACSTRFGDAPNTNVCPVCLGLPGTLPVFNKRVADLAVRAGLALGCKISPRAVFERKNYFYPDLPKAYQISQLKAPICADGGVMIPADEGGEKRVGIARIQIEEDAGKLLHRDGETLIDHNRCGVPLIEIVSDADMSSATEATAYLRRLRQELLFLGVCDCKMNEGSFRCDVNVSVRRPGEPLGVRCEIKNLNSFKFVEKAIEYEVDRQISVIEGGGQVECETRRFDEDTKKTFAMRKKETFADYRFFDEPDIPPVSLNEEELARIIKHSPKTLSERERLYRESLGLSENESGVLLKDVETADFFEAAAEKTQYKSLAASLVATVLLSMADENDTLEKRISPESFASIVNMLGSSRITAQTAKKLIAELWEEGDFDPQKRAEERGLFLICDEEAIAAFVESALEKSEKAIADYKKGKASAAKAIIGKAMAESRGRADPAIISRLVEELLSHL